MVEVSAAGYGFEDDIGVGDKFWMEAPACAEKKNDGLARGGEGLAEVGEGDSVWVGAG